MMLFVNMFQFAWQPFFLQNAKEPNAKEMFSKVLTYFTLVGSVILVVLSLFITDLAQIKIAGFSLVGSQYWAGLQIVPIILLAYLINGMYSVFSAGIYIEVLLVGILFYYLHSIGSLLFSYKIILLILFTLYIYFVAVNRDEINLIKRKFAESR